MLDTIVAKDSDERRVSARRARYTAQRVLWRVTNKPRLAYCGRFVTNADGGVDIVTGDRGAGFSGLQSCGSVWACPVCAEKVNAARQADLEHGITNWIDAGHGVVFGTFTVRHNRSQSLKELWDAVAPAWRDVIAGAAWAGGKRTLGIKQRFGVEGQVRLVEVKHGDNGWHVHLHVLFFLARDLDAEVLEDFRKRMFARWETALAKRHLKVLDRAQDGSTVGVDFRPVLGATYMADYMAKNNYRPRGTAAKAAAYEVTGSQSKKATKGGRTPFEILANLVEPVVEYVDPETGVIKGLPDPVDLALWHEWEEGSAGRRQLTWSRGLRDLLGLIEDELTDEQVVAESAHYDIMRWLLAHSQALRGTGDAPRTSRVPRCPSNVSERRVVATTSSSRCAGSNTDNRRGSGRYAVRPPPLPDPTHRADEVAVCIDDGEPSLLVEVRRCHRRTRWSRSEIVESDVIGADQGKVLLGQRSKQCTHQPNLSRQRHSPTLVRESRPSDGTCS